MNHKNQKIVVFMIEPPKAFRLKDQIKLIQTFRKNSKQSNLIILTHLLKNNLSPKVQLKQAIKNLNIAKNPDDFLSQISRQQQKEYPFTPEQHSPQNPMSALIIEGLQQKRFQNYSINATESRYQKSRLNMIFANMNVKGSQTHSAETTPASLNSLAIVSSCKHDKRRQLQDILQMKQLKLQGIDKTQNFDKFCKTAPNENKQQNQPFHQKERSNPLVDYMEKIQQQMRLSDDLSSFKQTEIRNSQQMILNNITEQKKMKLQLRSKAFTSLESSQQEFSIPPQIAQSTLASFLQESSSIIDQKLKIMNQSCDTINQNIEQKESSCHNYDISNEKSLNIKQQLNLIREKARKISQNKLFNRYNFKFQINPNNALKCTRFLKFDNSLQFEQERFINQQFSENETEQSPKNLNKKKETKFISRNSPEQNLSLKYNKNFSHDIDSASKFYFETSSDYELNSKSFDEKQSKQGKTDDNIIQKMASKINYSLVKNTDQYIAKNDQIPKNDYIQYSKPRKHEANKKPEIIKAQQFVSEAESQIQEKIEIKKANVELKKEENQFIQKEFFSQQLQILEFDQKQAKVITRPKFQQLQDRQDTKNSKARDVFEEFFESALNEIIQHKEKSIIPLAKFERIMAQLDELLRIRKYDPHIKMLKDSLNSFQVNKSLIEDETLKKLSDAYKSLNEYNARIQISDFKKRKKHNQIYDYNQVFIEMQNSMVENVMLQQLKQTDSSTRIYLNKVLEDEDRQLNYSDNSSASSKDKNETDNQDDQEMVMNQDFKVSINDYKESKSEADIILQIIRQKLNNMVKQEIKEIIKKDQAEVKLGGVQDVFQINKNTKQISEMLKGCLFNLSKKKKFSPATQKFREIVARHFLHVSLIKLEQIDLTKLSPMAILNLSKFKKSMLQCFPVDACRSLGRKYLQIGINKFQNEFLREVLEAAPQFGIFLRVAGMKDEEVRTEKIEINTEQLIELGDKTVSPDRISHTFKNNIDTQKFFQKAKRVELGKKDNQSVIFKAYKAYIDSMAQNDVINPNLLIKFFNQGILFFSQQNLKMIEVQGLYNFFTNLKDDPAQQIQQIIVDSCNFSDEMMATLLSACINQTKPLKDVQFPTSIIRKLQHLSSVVYLNNTIGYETVNRIITLSECLIEIKLCRLNFKPNCSPKSLLTYLIDEIRYRGDYLMKLTLSDINLGDDQIVTALCETIQQKKNLQYLDLSHGNLQPRHLAQISLAMSPMIQQFRDLNFSYNKLYSNDEERKNQKNQAEHHDEDSDEAEQEIFVNSNCKYSEIFLTCTMKIIEASKILNHINLSGMDMSRNQLRQVCLCITKSRLLMGVHLNDNGISQNQQLMQELMDILGLKTDDLPQQRNEFSDYQANVQTKQAESKHDKNKKDKKQNEQWLKLQRRNSIKSQKRKTETSPSSKKETESNMFSRNNNYNDYEIGNYKETLQPYFRNKVIMRSNSQSRPMQPGFPGQFKSSNVDRSQLERSQRPTFTGFKIRQIDQVEFKPSVKLFDDEWKQKMKREARNKNRFQYAQHALLAKEIKEIERQKEINECVCRQGVGRNTQDMGKNDYFIITRVLNHPELCFNQRPKYDFSDKRFRFFQRDASSFWTLQAKNDCFICERHSYALITYERGSIAQNHGIIEIQDEKIINQLRYHYKKHQIEFKNKTPLICGSIVKKRFPNSCIFERRLKMLRAPIFALLTIIASKNFSDTAEAIYAVKDGCQRFLVYDNIELLKLLKVENSLEGWQYIINDMALNNELSDVKIINYPDLSAQNLKQREFYMFAGFLNPGYHQILIYDPETDRVFVKDFVVGLNQRDFVYPEYPLPLGDPILKIIPNMWRRWIEDSEEALRSSFQSDLTSDSFEIEKFIKNPQDQQDVIDILRNSFDKVQVFQKQLMVRSNLFPQVGWEAIQSFLQEVQSRDEFIATNGNTKFSRAQIELSFIRATRNDSTKGLQSAMQRSELLDFMMRLAQQFIVMKHSTKVKIADHLDEFFFSFIDPLIAKSTIHPHRVIIRRSVKLNELLYDNNEALVKLFDESRKAYGEKNKFTKECAQILFMLVYEGNHYTINMSNQIINENFIFSMMTVLNEHKSMDKYQYLVFVEFQELICRLALVCLPGVDTVEWKVFIFLDLVFQKMYETGKWDKNKIQLIEISRQISF